MRGAIDIAFWQNFFAALILLPFAAGDSGALGNIGARAIALLLILGLVCTALAHTLFISALSRLSAHTASIVAALEPVYGIALAALLLGEIPGPRIVMGGTLIVGAALVATRRGAAMVGEQHVNR